MKPAFDTLIHAPGRLQICAMLSAVDEAEFATVREQVEVSDSVLSKHLKALGDLGYGSPTQSHVPLVANLVICIVGTLVLVTAMIRRLARGPKELEQ